MREADVSAEYDRLDELVDTDPLALRDEAFRLLRENQRLLDRIGAAIQLPHLVGQLQAALDDRGREAHQVHQLFSSGRLHPGTFETCTAMSCEDARRLLARCRSALSRR